MYRERYTQREIHTEREREEPVAACRFKVPPTVCVKTSQVSLGLKRVKTMVRVRG